MKQPSPYVCDQKGCGKAKAPSNGWFLIVEYDPDSFRSIKWDDTLADEKGVMHACSAECASKLYGTWLATVQNPPVVNPAIPPAFGNVPPCECWTERNRIIIHCYYDLHHEGPHSYDMPQSANAGKPQTVNERTEEHQKQDDGSDGRDWSFNFANIPRV